MDFGRRELFLGVSGLAMMAASGPASAQSFDFPYRREFLNAFQEAVNALSRALDHYFGTELTNTVEAGATEEWLREALSNLAGFGTAENLAALSRTEHADLVEEMIGREEVSAPDPEVLDIILSAEPEADSDNWLDAFTDILLKSLGLDPEIGPQMADALRYLDIPRDLQALREAILNRDWVRCQRVLRDICGKIFSRGGLQAVAERVDDQVYRQLLRAIGARAVPYLGWGWFALSLALTIYEQRDRLEALLMRQD